MPSVRSGRDGTRAGSIRDVARSTSSRRSPWRGRRSSACAPDGVWAGDGREAACLTRVPRQGPARPAGCSGAVCEPRLASSRLEPSDRICARPHDRATLVSPSSPPHLSRPSLEGKATSGPPEPLQPLMPRGYEHAPTDLDLLCEGSFASSVQEGIGAGEMAVADTARATSHHLGGSPVADRWPCGPGAKLLAHRFTNLSEPRVKQEMPVRSLPRCAALLAARPHTLKRHNERLAMVHQHEPNFSFSLGRPSPLARGSTLVRHDKTLSCSAPPASQPSEPLIGCGLQLRAW